MEINITNLMPLISAVFVIGLGFFVFKRNTKAALNRVFFGLSIALSIWLFGTYKLFTSITDVQALEWDRVIYIGVVFIPTLMYHYSLEFTRIKNQRIQLFLGYIISTFFLITSRTDLFINEVFRYTWGLHAKAQLFHHFFLIFFCIYVALTLFNLYRYYKGTLSTLQRQQARYNFLAFAFLISIGTLAYLPAYNIGIYPFAYLSGLIFTVILSYAIVRYRLMNIKFALTKSLIYVVLVTIIATVFVLASSITASLFQQLGVNQYIVWIIFAILVVGGLDPLKNLFASLTDRIFYKDKIDYNAVLKSLSNLINEEIQLDSLVEHVEDDLVKELKVQDSQLLLGVYGEQIFLPLTDYLAFTPAKRSKNRVAADKHVYYNSALIQYMRKVKMPIVTDEFERYIYDLDEPTKQKKLTKILHDMQSLKSGTTVPIIREGKMVALLLVGGKVSGETFSNDDINLLEVLSSQLAAAIERSKLYQEVQDFNAKLQKEVEKATKNLQRANEQLKEANVHLKELDSAKSEFMSIASHQLRTPLAGIVGYLSMILEGDYGKIDTSQQKIVSEVFAASQRLVRLVNTFLNVTRIEAGRFTLAFSEVNFVDLVRGEVMELQPTADKKNVTLVYEEPKDKNITAMVDDKIKDAVLNLIDNAIKYTPEGTVTVQLKKEDKDTLLFSVKDSGVGISKGEAGNLFQKFVRGSGIAKVQPNGSGLGLYIVKKIVEGHGGKVWAESEGEGKGSTFNIRIPIKQKKSEYRAKAEQIFTGRTGAAE